MKNIVSELTIFFYDETVGKGGKHTTKIVVITVLSIALAVVAALFNMISHLGGKDEGDLIYLSIKFCTYL